MRAYVPYLQIILAFIIWSFVGVVVRLSHFAPLQTLWLASLTTCGTILLILYLTERLKSFQRRAFSPWLLVIMILQGFMGVAVFESLARMPIGSATLITNLSPLFVAVFAPIILHERTTKKVIIALVIGLLGLGFIASPQNITGNNFFSQGIFFALSSAILLALLTINNRKISKQYSPLFITFWGMLGQVLVTFPFVLTNQWQSDGFSSIITISLGISAVAPFALWISALRKVRAVTASLLALVEPLFSYLWGFLLFKELLSLPIVIGGFLIIFSGYYAIRSKNA